jgi:glycosyltransferase involved in cell wall biosynthesis
VGRRPAPQIRKLARRPGVELVGEVSDVLPYLWRSRLVVVPLRIARGIQNKVLEALAARRAVIASSPALEGLGVVPGEHVLKADSPAEWIRSISMLLANEAACRRLGNAGREFVGRHHRWSDCLRPIDELLGFAERGQQLSNKAALSQTLT